MTEYYTPEESQLLVELAIVLASFAGTQLLEEDFPVIGEPSYLQDKYLRQAQAVLKVVQRNKAALAEPVNKQAYKSAEELAIERMGDIDNPDMWTTVVRADEEIDIEEVLEHLRQRGYKIEEPDSMLWRKPSAEAVARAEEVGYLLKNTLISTDPELFGGDPTEFAEKLSEFVFQLTLERMTKGSRPLNLKFDYFLADLEEAYED